MATRAKGPHNDCRDPRAQRESLAAPFRERAVFLDFAYHGRRKDWTEARRHRQYDFVTAVTWQKRKNVGSASVVTRTETSAEGNLFHFQNELCADRPAGAAYRDDTLCGSKSIPVLSWPLSPAIELCCVRSFRRRGAATKSLA